MALSGLTQTDSSAIIDPYKTRFQISGESYSIAGGITAGAVIGIANFVIPFIAALRTDLKRPGKFVFLLLLSIFGTPITGTAAGFLGYGAGQWAISNKMARLTKLMFAHKYEPTSLIEPQDVAKQLQEVDDEAKNALITKMNFGQLLAAKQVLGDKELRRFIQPINQEAHQNMKFVLNVSKQTDLSNYQIRDLVSRHPQIGLAIQEHLGSSVTPNLFLPALAAEKSDVAEVKIIAGDKWITANKALLMKNSEYFGRAFNSGMIEGAENTITLVDHDYEDVKLLIDVLTHKAPLTLENCAKLIPIADKFGESRLLNAVGNILIAYKDWLSDETIETLLDYQSLTIFRKKVEAGLLAQKPTHKNCRQMFKLALRFNFAALKTKCLEFAKQNIVLMAPFHQLAAQNEAVKTEIVNFCASNRQVILDNAVWQHGDYPQDIYQILFPENNN
jgi:hypothetical protein